MRADGSLGEDELFETLQADGASFQLEIAGISGPWGVRRVSFQERLSRPFAAVVEAVLSEGTAPEADQLLGRLFALEITRGGETRNVRGLVRQASASNRNGVTQIQLHLVPSIWRLGLGMDTRTHDATTIPDLVTLVVDEHLGPGVVDVDHQLSRVYETHEFLVQYRESALSFLSRWMEQEGLFFFSSTRGDREVLTLVDSLTNLPVACAGTNGEVVHQGPEATDRPEILSGLQRTREVGVTAVIIAGYDWTNPALEVCAKNTATSEIDPPAWVYDHANAVTFHRYDGQQYLHNSAQRAAELRSEALHAMRETWTARSNLISAQPGHVLTVVGSPEGEFDGEYMITGAESIGIADENLHGSWINRLVLVPTSAPFRPPLETPRPIVSGPETATVVGPKENDDIHTDVHGRVQVHFHWDRRRDRGNGNVSCWVRAQHAWAGPGFGTLFLPRVGMEVVVNFLGGNPDSPIITGCLYNGRNRTGVQLPAEKTVSTIRTDSNGEPGFNELKFDDDAGHESISIHAQKNMSEAIENDHSSRVGRDQSATIGRDQNVNIAGNQNIVIGRNETPGPLANPGAGLDIAGEYDLKVSSKMTVSVGESSKLIIDGSTITLETSKKFELKVGDSTITIDRTSITGKSATIMLQAGEGPRSVLKLDGDADLKGGRQVHIHKDNSALTLREGNAALEGPVVGVTGDTSVTIAGGGGQAEFSGGEVALNA